MSLEAELVKEKRFTWKHGCMLFCSAVAAFFLAADTNVVYSGAIFGLYSENYMEPFVPGDIALWLLLTCVCYGLLHGMAALYRKFGSVLLRNCGEEVPPKKQLRVFLLASGVIFAAWIPYLLSYVPGGLYSDSFSSLYQVLYHVFHNHHPLLFTFTVGLFVKVGMKLGGTLAAGTMTYTVAQTIVMALVMGYFVSWLRKKGVRKAYCVVVTIFIAVFPLFPYYAIAMWKDTPFSLSMLLYILYLIDIIQSDGEKLSDLAGVMKYLVLTFFVCFYRNNGIYICLLVHLALSLLYWKRVLTTLKQFQVLSVIAIIAYFILYGPVYSALNLSSEAVESLGVTNQQLFIVFADEDGEYTQEEADAVSKFWDPEEMAEKYAPMIADVPKWHMDSFDETYLNEHLSEYFKVWFSLCLKNFDLYVEAWLMETMSFWSPTHGGAEAYIQDGVWPNDYGLSRRDLFYEWFGWSFSDLVTPDDYIAPGLLFWLAMLFTGVTFIASPKRKSLASLIPMLPILGLWLTLMIATPIAVSLRYAYPFVLVLPLLPVLPILFGEAAAPDGTAIEMK